MSTMLITGASGFIGRALAASLAKKHSVVCMSRRKPEVDCPYVRGDFGSFEDLRQLDGRNFDAVVHLGAVTGGCLEREGLLVNVEGTRCLMRYLMDRGCRKFVMASSIAVVGLQSLKFRPARIPIPDEHPCLDRDGYGLSKYLMEEVTRYYARQNDGLDVINLRLATIGPDEPAVPLKKVGPLHEWSLAGITVMCLSDAVRAFSLAAEAPHKPGVRVMNAVGPRAWVQDPVADILRNWWGDDVDVSAFRRPGHEWDSVFDAGRIEQELGFVAQRLPQRSSGG
jgi:nucleoside-diphosphate-sugar epimerase